MSGKSKIRHSSVLITGETILGSYQGTSMSDVRGKLLRKKLIRFDFRFSLDFAAHDS